MMLGVAMLNSIQILMVSLYACIHFSHLLTDFFSSNNLIQADQVVLPVCKCGKEHVCTCVCLHI